MTTHTLPWHDRGEDHMFVNLIPYMVFVFLFVWLFVAGFGMALVSAGMRK